MVYSNTAVYGGKLVWLIQSLVILPFFEAPKDAFELPIFQGFILTPYQRHALIACRAMYAAQILKVETLLNNASEA